MSSIATLNGVQYIIPQYNDTGWAQGAGNLSLYLAAIAANTLQPTGGSFTLTADVDFGANFGVKALFLKTETANPASAGVIRLASADTIKWRNNANGADIALSKDTSDNLQYNATKVLLSGAVVNADINASAAIAYSKLALTGAILNADLAGSIAYSKLSLTGAVLNADLAGSIAVNKLVALGLSKAVATDGSGFLVAATTTATELGYVAGVTSAIQTQLTAKANVAGQTFTDNIAFNPTTKGVVGTTTNDSAAAGNVGEYIASVVTGTNFPTSSQYGDLTSIAVTAGDWDIFVMACAFLNGATISGDTDFGYSTTSGNSSTGLTLGDTYLQTPALNASFWVPVTVVGRITVASPTTYYLKYRSNFTGGPPQGQGKIFVRRRR